MVITFNEALEFDTVAKLIKEIDEAIVSEYKEHKASFVTLYFASTGGCVSSSELLLDYLNLRKASIHLVVFDRCDSCAFSMYANFEGKKKLLRGASSYLHLVEIKVGTREDLKNETNLKSSKKDLEKSNNELLLLLEKLNVPSETISKVKKGQDVLLYHEELSKLNW